MSLVLSEDQLSLIITTESNYSNAEKLAKKILDMRLATCISFTQINSMYLWKGEIENSSEVQLNIKTKEKLVDEVFKVLKKLHSYSIPEVVCITASASNEYKDWLEGELGK